MAVDKRIEVEIALRDTASLTLRAVADNLERINQALGKREENKAAGGGEEPFKKVKESTEGIRKLSEEGAQQITGHAERVLPLVGKMTGPLGRAVWAIALTKYVTDKITGWSKEELELRAMVEDTSFPEKFIDVLQQAQKKMGIKDGEANANIIKFGNILADTAYGKGSAITKELDKIGEGKLATAIEDLVGVGKNEEAARLVFKHYAEVAKSDAIQARRIADAFKIPPSFFSKMTETLKTVQPRVHIQYKEALKMWGGWVDVLTITMEALRKVQAGGVMTLNRSFDIAGMVWDWLKTSRGNPLNPFSNKIPQEELEAFKERNKDALKTLQEILSVLQGAQNKWSLEKREMGGLVQGGRSYLVGERGPEMFSSGGTTQMVGMGGPEVFTPTQGGDLDPGHRGMGPDDPGDEAPPGFWAPERTTPYFRPPRSLPGDTPETAWERLHREFKLRPWLGVPEGNRLPGEGMYPGSEYWPGPDPGSGSSGIPKSNVFKGYELEMEQSLRERGAPMEEHWRIWRERRDEGFWPDKASFRSDIDSEFGGFSDGGSLDAEVVFKNVPPDVDTSVEAEGFDSFTVNKTRQLEI